MSYCSSHRFAPIALLDALLMVLLIAIDQGTKILVSQNLAYGESVPVIDGFFNLCLVHNSGAAFSFLGNAGGWQRFVFIGIALVIGAVLLTLWYKNIHKRLFALSCALVLSGAIGNLIDRIYLGFVVDFLDFYIGLWHWPAFNVADTTICVGAAGLVLGEFWQHKKNTDKAH